MNGNQTGVPVAQLLLDFFLVNNGGYTRTVALQAGSIAINAGATVAGLSTDQRGVARPQYNVPDVGAYEYNSALSPSLVVTTR